MAEESSEKGLQYSLVQRADGWRAEVDQRGYGWRPKDEVLAFTDPRDALADALHRWRRQVYADANEIERKAMARAAEIRAQAETAGG